MKLIITLFFSVVILYASEQTDHLRTKVLEKVFAEISINGKLKIWSDNKEVLSQFKKHGTFKTEDNCEDANLIVLDNKDNITKSCQNKHIFTLSYSLLSDIPSSFGAFFWKKGRPNIVIIEPRIKSQSIKVSKSLEEYLEERIW